MHSDKADYSLLLENLRQAFYAIKNNPYTNGGSIFYIDQEDSAKKIRDEHVKKSIDKNRNITIGKFYQDRIDRYKAFFTIGEYQDFIGHYTTSLPTGSSSVQVGKGLNLLKGPVLLPMTLNFTTCLQTRKEHHAESGQILKRIWKK